ncbi:MAG: response regulator [Dissulfurimicrobium sp.]|uniref:response regulator n=2 Tax=Dissulfurimicrobium sp. TaxID=2022436 RepID=UPI0040494FAF
MPDNARIRTLVVDDTVFMRRALVDILSQDKGIEVVGVAKHGREALEAIEVLRPDVVTLDVDMPVMDGLTAIKHIMIKNPTPIVMISGLAGHGRVTLEALCLGAVDFFPKPSGTISLDIHSQSEELSQVVVQAARINPKTIKRVRFRVRKADGASTPRNIKPLGLIIIIAGKGSFGPFIRLLVNLRPKLPLSILCIQDISSEVLGSYSKELNSIVPWDVSLVEKDTELRHGSCLLATKDRSLGIDADDLGEIKIVDAPPGQAEVLFEQAARLMDGHCMAVVMGEPECQVGDGLERIKAGGGEVLFFDPNFASTHHVDTPHQMKQNLILNEYDLLARIDAFGRRLFFDGLTKKRFETAESAVRNAARYRTDGILKAIKNNF